MPTMIGRVRFLESPMTNLIDRLRNAQNGDAADLASAVNLSPCDVRILKRYLVLDLPHSNEDRNDIEVVLVVESPDVHEVCHKHPLAGTSGENVTKKYVTRMINDSDKSKPIGCLAVSRQIRWLSLMNVSQLPLSQEFYCVTQPNYSDELKRLLQSLGKIKNILQRKRYINYHPPLDILSNNVYDIIVGDLACRVRQIRHRQNPLFVPCGNFAYNSLQRTRGFLQRIRLDICIYQESDIPHPTVANKNEYRSRLDALANAIRLRVRRTTNEG